MTDLLPRPAADPHLTDFMENNDYDSLAKYLVGNNERFRENIIIPRILGPVIIKTNEEKMIDAAIESCPFKSITSCVVGEFMAYLCVNCVDTTIVLLIEQFHLSVMYLCIAY